jgi:heme oxygenase (biliverdin-IX-beta and delta-forming)
MSASKANLHVRLRECTCALHDQLERVVGVNQRIATRASYTAYLAELWTLYSAAENALDLLDFRSWGFDYSPPRRSCLLSADLDFLGVSASRLADLTLPPAPQLDGNAAGLGCVYVLEGSAKGARAILPEIIAALGLDAAGGASFFKGFGPETRRVWQACLAAINGIDANSRQADSAVDAAVATFAMFLRAFTPGPRPRLGTGSQSSHLQTAGH